MSTSPDVLARTSTTIYLFQEVGRLLSFQSVFGVMLTVMLRGVDPVLAHDKVAARL